MDVERTADITSWSRVACQVDGETVRTHEKDVPRRSWEGDFVSAKSIPHFLWTWVRTCRLGVQPKREGEKKGGGRVLGRCRRKRAAVSSPLFGLAAHGILLRDLQRGGHKKVSLFRSRLAAQGIRDGRSHFACNCSSSPRDPVSSFTHSSRVVIIDFPRHQLESYALCQVSAWRDGKLFVRPSGRVMMPEKGVDAPIRIKTRRLRGIDMRRPRRTKEGRETWRLGRLTLTRLHAAVCRA